MIKDFYFGLTLINNYDNMPPAGGTEKNDLTTTLSVGYSF